MINSYDRQYAGWRGSRRLNGVKHLISGAALTLALFTTSPAYAYIDPSTGSLAIQMIIASVVGVAFTVKMFWKKILHMLKGIFSKRSIDEDKNPEK